MTIQGIAEGYVEVVEQREMIMPSEDSAKIFIALCEGIDKYKHQEYRLDYTPKRMRKGSYKITIRDIGE